jgi:amino acid transporter
MSEEVKEPSIVIPRAMIGTILVNGVLGFGMIIALLFCMGDINEVLTSPVSLAGYPFIQIYFNATQSYSGTNAMTSVSLVIVIMAHFGLMAGCSRTTWAFARDRGLPGSSFLDHVGEKSQVPFRAIILSVVIQVLLGLINIGSYYAFSAFVNAAAVTLYITYVSSRVQISETYLLMQTDHSRHTRPYEAHARRANTLRSFSARQVENASQPLCDRLHALRVVLPALAKRPAHKWYDIDG